MPSQSLTHWNERAAIALDRMEEAHRAVGGTGRGRRYATQQINQSYLMLVSSHFQQFCRSLHSEAAGRLTSSLGPALRPIMFTALTVGRKLDQGNPNPGNLGADFGRLGMNFWDDVTAFGNATAYERPTLARWVTGATRSRIRTSRQQRTCRSSAGAPRSRCRKYAPFAAFVATSPLISTLSSSRTSKWSQDRTLAGNL